eukprot:gene4082-20262_t
MAVDTRAKRVHSFGRDVALDSQISCSPSWEHSISTLSHSRSVPHRSTMQPEGKVSHLAPVPSSAFPKSGSIADLLDARKFIQPPSVTRMKLDLSAYDVAETMWNPSGSIAKSYFSTIEGNPVTVEEFIPGKFQKYINNTGQIRKPELAEDRILIEKAECLVHYTYVHTKKELMVLDLQGVDYVLCDPEIATATLHEDGELIFCAGNLVFKAISTFFAEHSSNNYCRMLNLTQEQWIGT